jgi:two-component system sensor histidine kinase RegB
MHEQIDLMNRRLTEIAKRAGAERSEGARCVGLRAFLENLIAEWCDAHPGMTVEASYELSEPHMTIIAEATIEQAIRNVLDNAAHATRSNGRSVVEVVARCSNGKLDLAVLDNGGGLDPAVRDEVGLRILSTKDRGLGIGLLLSRAALQRFGGNLELRSRPAGGVEARIDLPLQGLVTDAR